MSTIQFPEETSIQVAELYREMEEKYDELAKSLDFTCQGCPDNCCDSYFLHHTYTEWAYLWEGLNKLSEERRNELIERSKEVMLECEKMLGREERPTVMCPLNDNGLCSLYKHRMMICRLHGVPSSMTRPDGQQMKFPGCFRCQEIVGDRDVTHLDRTSMYQRLVQLEMGWLGPKRNVLPKVKMTIAQMIVQGPPELSFC